MDSKERFSARVTAYLAGRPSYPAAIVRHLEELGALRAGAVIADVGVGTGLSAEPFLRAGYAVVGVEPNAPMRAGGEEYLAQYPRYRSVDGNAEATTLETASVDLVLAAQAFHWFDPVRFRAEARRIAKSGGYGALVWNDRDVVGTAFLSGYEALLVEYGSDYENIRDRHGGQATIPTFFGGTGPTPALFRHTRTLRWEDVAALAGSASYLPAPGAEKHAPFMHALRALFDDEASEGAIEMRYTTRLFAARLD